MKFGETLKNRSIPEWTYHNVDYDEVKQLIKAGTSDDRTQAVAIPGQGAGVDPWNGLEDELFVLLEGEHDRVNMFAKTKSHELQQKLLSCQKKVDRTRNQILRNPKAPNRGRQQESFALLEKFIMSVGAEIQALLRFVNLNRTAFKKLLKKYKKWTESEGLEVRFKQEILNSQTSCLVYDYDRLFQTYTNIVAYCRETFQCSLRPGGITDVGKTSPLPPKDKSPIEEISRISSNPPSEWIPLDSLSQDAADLDFDSSLATLPLGQHGGRATYWIHYDNLVAVQVLLLQYMKDPGRQRQIPVSSARSSISTLPVQSIGESPAASTDDVNLAIFDDIDEFSRKQSTTTIGYLENALGTISEKAALSARWSNQSDAVVTLIRENRAEEVDQANTSQLQHAVISTRAKRRNLPTLFDVKEQIPEASGHGSSTSSSEPLKIVREFLETHPQVKPLVHISSRRSRFIGLNNRLESGLWGTLDMGITMKQVDLENTGRSATSPPAEHHPRRDMHAMAFPHCVLELRWEGNYSNYSTDLVQALDQSHLVERVRGFSMETHAVSSLCKPPDIMPLPFWLPVLERDIRKVPPENVAGPSRSNSKRISIDSMRANGGKSASVTSYDHSGFSAAPGISSATSVQDIQDSEATLPPKRSRSPRSRRYGTVRDEESGEVIPDSYFSEYNNDEYGQPREDPYYLTVYPKGWSFGLQHMSKLWEKARTGLRRKGRFGEDGSEEPLLRAPSECASFESSDDEDNTLPSNVQRPLLSELIGRRFTRAPTRYRPGQFHGTSYRQRDRERWLLTAYIGAFVTSFVVLFITAFLPFTSKKKERPYTEIGVITGSVVAIAFGSFGVWCYMKRRDDLGWLHRGAVLLAFAIDLVASISLSSVLVKGGIGVAATDVRWVG